MNKKMVFHLLGQIILAGSAMMVLPLVVSLIYAEWRGVGAFAAAIGAGIIPGGLLAAFCKPEKKTIFAKEGFVIVALSWVALSAFGALPFFISREIPNYIDAFFETVSGFTTTGASILENVEALSKGMLFWRSFTHWIGGMGVLVFVVALIPSVCDRSIHMLKAEMPGPIVGKLVPRAKQTAKILYLIYIVMTLVEMVFLLCGGMSLFDSAVHSFGTAGTGGFGIKADSIAGYSPYIQWVITVFMLLFGINFNLFYLLLIRRFKSVFQSTELWVYLGIVTVSASVIAINIYNNVAQITSAGEAIRHSWFTVASVVTTTGYSTSDFNLWPQFSKGIIFVLMFSGACAGSTSGGLKISRILMLFKIIGRELRKMIHPRSVSAIRYEGKKLEDATLTSTANYFLLYIVVFVIIFLVISVEPFSFESNFTAVTACFNNIGPGFDTVGPAGNFAAYSVLSKIILSVAMLFGRLEIYPLIFALAPSTWFKRAG